MGINYAFFSSRYAPEVGGVESFSANLAQELVSMGNEVTIVTSNTANAPSRETQSNGVEIVRLPCRPLMNGRLPLSVRNWEFKNLLNSECLSHVDRVLVNTRFYGHSITGLSFAQDRSLPAVVLDHGSAYLTLGNPVADLAIHAHEHLITHRCISFSPTFAGISRASVKWLKTFGIDTNHVIPNSIDASAFRALSSGRDFRKELGVSTEKTLVVSVGRLTPEKGAVELVDAARLLDDSFTFFIAGDGFLRKELEDCLPDNVFLLGNLSHPDLSALLSQADLVCLPSRSEGFCTSLLEAGAWGLTPAITHVGGSDEVMGNPTRFGEIIPRMDAESIASTLGEMVVTGETGHLDALQIHVEENCSWAASVKALEDAFV